MNKLPTELIQKEFQKLSAIYFNAAYFGPAPLRSQLLVQQALERECNPSFYAYADWIRVQERTRQMMAQFLGVNSDNVFHSTSVSDIVAQVARSLPLTSQDIVCSFQGEYPSNVLPWMAMAQQGKCQMQLLDCWFPTVEWLQQHLPVGTKVVNLSHVAFNTGRKVDLVAVGKFLQERGIVFIVDVTQSLGGMPLLPQEIGHIDVLAGASYKWLLGPYGHAFGYLSPSLLQQVQGMNVNWINSINSHDVYHLLDYTTESLAGARKFDRGQTPNMLINACLEGSLGLLLELGASNIANHNAYLRDQFLQQISSKKYHIVTPREGLSNILCLKLAQGDPLQLEKELKLKNIDLSVREGNVRISFHCFNTLDHVHQILQSLNG